MDQAPELIRIQVGQRIWIQIGNQDPQPCQPKLSPKRKILENFMFKELSSVLGFKKKYMVVFDEGKKNSKF
jgi:hypothetical protein